MDVRECIMYDCLLDMDMETGSRNVNFIHVDENYRKLNILFLSGSSIPLFDHLTIKNLFQYIKNQISNIEEHTSVSGNLYQSLRMRDLKSICDTESYQAPSVTLRRFVVIITIVPIRAVLLPNQLILVLPQGADNFIDILQTNIEEWKNEQLINHGERSDCASNHNSHNNDVKDAAENVIKNINTNCNYNYDKKFNENDALFSYAYDECALFSILSTIISINRRSYESHKFETKKILLQIKENESIITKLESQELIRSLKNNLANQIEAISDLTTFLNDLLDDDEELALMALTKFTEEPSRYKVPLSDRTIKENHESIEKLLYPFLIDCYSLQANVDELRGDIRNAEELIKLRLDIVRNRLLLANTIISLLGTNFACAAFLTGIFGMNLDNQGLNLFTIVSSTIVIFLLAMIAGSLLYLKKSGALPY